jgi:uncharacterized coiled-coil protein SlyX
MRCSGKLLRILGLGAFFAQGAVLAQNQPPTDPALQVIIEQNRLLQEQVKEQQKTIEALNARMEDIRKASERQERALQSLQERADAVAAPDRPVPVESSPDHEVRIGGESGLGFFKSGSEGQFPNSEFRVDDTTITVEAPVWKDVYFFTELKLLTREASAANFEFGELYVEFEGLGEGWGRPDSLNLRAGSINIPFGEEYQLRGPMENPLISHSLSDIWGPDEGVEVYGKLGSWSYVVAVQNGGISQLHDFNSDKSLTARLGWDPVNWLHLSASAMRTGDLATVSPVTTMGDSLSALWFANGFIRALGPASRTPTFWADLYEADAVARWQGGHLSGALGDVRFDDSDPLVNDSRRMRYGYLEAMQSVTDKLYGAARFSGINAPGGYPLAGLGSMGEYFFRPSLTEELRRLSLGFGYRIGPPLVLKLEYSWEWGRTTTGDDRGDEDFLGAEIGLKF